MPRPCTRPRRKQWPPPVLRKGQVPMAEDRQPGSSLGESPGIEHTPARVKRAGRSGHPGPRLRRLGEREVGLPAKPAPDTSGHMQRWERRTLPPRGGVGHAE